MNEAKAIKTDAADPALLRLLRLVAAGPAETSADGADMLLRRAGSERAAMRVTAALLRTAISSGLVERRQDTICAAPQLSSYLKRANVKDRDEIFQHQHREIEKVVVDLGGERHQARRNLNNSPLTALARLKERDGAAFFSEDALQAGERLAADFHRAQLNPKVTSTWEPKTASRTRGEAGGMLDLTETAMAARIRFSRAVEAVGPELSGVAIDVCCFEKGLETVERERQWPARSAKLLLRAALLALSRHYAPPVAHKGRKSHHWGDTDFRPRCP